MGIRITSAAKGVGVKPVAPRPPKPATVKPAPAPATKVTANAASNVVGPVALSGILGAGAAFLPGLLQAGGSVGTAAIAADAVKSALDTMAQSPTVALAVAAVAVLLLLR